MVCWIHDPADGAVQVGDTARVAAAEDRSLTVSLQVVNVVAPRRGTDQAEGVQASGDGRPTLKVTLALTEEGHRLFSAGQRVEVHFTLREKQALHWLREVWSR